MSFLQVTGFLIFVSVVVAVPLSSNNANGNRLIKLDEKLPAEWMTETDIWGLIEKKVNFVDVTGRVFPEIGMADVSAIPETIRFQTVVNPVIANINIPRMETFVDIFDNFPNRYYSNQNGVDAADWLLSQVDGILLNTTHSGVATVDKFMHTWPQNSIIARIQGSDPILKDEVIIFGAHLDSVNSRNPTQGIAPGSDDNASGSVTLLESFRVLLESGIGLKRSIEFQWYAAEEVGLRGSGDIAESYFNQDVRVVAMVNFDVVGYKAGRDEIGFLTDYTNPTLTAFLKLVVDEYCSYPWTNDFCGYGCSDHASFHEFGFPVAAPNEFPVSPYMHTVSDTVNTMSFEQVAEFVKLTVAAGIEIAEPVDA